MRPKCPKPEALLELLTIPNEISWFRRYRLNSHSKHCSGCQAQLSRMQESWDGYFTPDPDITQSILRVYNRLQSDETLILKGWKLSETKRSRSFSSSLLQGGWLFRGGVSLGMAAMVAFIVVTSLHEDIPPTTSGMTASTGAETLSGGDVPFAKIRIEDKDRVKVHYIQPELLQTIEFETASTE